MERRPFKAEVVGSIPTLVSRRHRFTIDKNPKKQLVIFMTMKNFYSWYWQVAFVIYFLCSPICFDERFGCFRILSAVVCLIVASVGIIVTRKLKKEVIGLVVLKEAASLVIAMFYGYLYVFHRTYIFWIIPLACFLIFPIDHELQKRLK